MNKKLLFLITAAVLILNSCTSKKDWAKRSERPEYLHRTMKAITDRIVFDIFSPPVASRIYTYASVAAYEAGRYSDSTLVSLSGQLNGLGVLPQPEAGKEYSFSLAATQALYTTGRTLIFSEDVLKAEHEEMMKSYKKESGMPGEVWNRSIAFGDSVAVAILRWSSKDNYKQTRSFPKYTILSEEYSWKPTPPAYMDAIEPHWNKIRTFVLDSASQFKPAPPVPFSTKKGSEFYKLAEQVYQARINLTDEQKLIANFWDCNPFMMNVNGHVMFANKKISPGGHWINILTQVSKKEKLSTARSAEAYARVAVALFEGFVVCWDEKYRSKLIRPETYINQYIDENWVPLLQTPPFPEHTSGHSTISGSASVILENYFGKDYAFIDSTETEFGIPVRSFKSFDAAAEEASMSRFYGGIHYIPALTEGLKKGREVGEFVSSQLKTRK